MSEQYRAYENKRFGKLFRGLLGKFETNTNQLSSFLGSAIGKAPSSWLGMIRGYENGNLLGAYCSITPRSKPVSYQIETWLFPALFVLGVKEDSEIIKVIRKETNLPNLPYPSKGGLVQLQCPLPKELSPLESFLQKALQLDAESKSDLESRLDSELKKCFSLNKRIRIKSSALPLAYLKDLGKKIDKRLPG